MIKRILTYDSFLKRIMKNITHYFRRENRPEEEVSVKELDRKDSQKPCDEDSNADTLEIYTSDDDASVVVCDSGKRKSHLIVQVPGIDESLEYPNSNKRICSTPVFSNKKSKKISSNSSLLDITPVAGRKSNFCDVDAENCSYYMSPLRLDSDESSVGNHSLNLKQEEEDSVSPRINIYSRKRKSRKRLRLLMNENKNINGANSDKVSNSVITTIDNVENDIFQDDLGGKNVSEKTEVLSIEEGSPSLPLKNPVNVPGMWNLGNTLVDVEDDQMCPDKVAHSAFSLLMSGKVNRTDRGESTALNKKKRRNSGGFSESLTQSGSSTLKKRKNESSKDTSPGMQLQEIQNSLLNYFYKKESPTEPSVLDSKKVSKRKNWKKKKDKRSSEIPPEDVISGRKASYVSKSNPVASKEKTNAPKRSQVKETDDAPKDKNISAKALEEEPVAFTSNKNYRRRSDKYGDHWTVKENSGLKMTVRLSADGQEIPKKGSRKKKFKDDTLRDEVKLGSSNSSSEDFVISRPLTRTASLAIKESTSNKEERKRSSARLEKKKMEMSKSSQSEDTPVASKSNCGRPKSKVVPQRSANQRMAVQIVRRACKNSNQKYNVKKSKGNLPQSISSNDEIVVLSSNAKGKVSEIVIKPAYVKIAPLFLAKDELRRKQVFLQSGTPEVLQKRLQQQKKLETEIEEGSFFPKVTHTLQCNQEMFPWNLEKKPCLVKDVMETVCPLAVQQEMEEMLSSRKMPFGIVSEMPMSLALLLMCMRPPKLEDVIQEKEECSSLYQTEEYMPCFCPEESGDQEVSLDPTPVDIAKFERVHAWLLRSMLPPNMAFKMHMDLSSYLPLPSTRSFAFHQISALPINESDSLNLRKKILLKLKEEYTGFPVNRWFKIFRQRRKAHGGLYMDINSVSLAELDDSKKRGDDSMHTPDEKVACSTTKTSSNQSSLRRSRRKLLTEECATNSPEYLLGDIKLPDYSAVKSTEHLPENVKLINVADSPPSSSLLDPRKVQTINGMLSNVPLTYSHALFSSELWSDVFAPLSYDDACILGRNRKTIEKLQNWLEKWKGSSQDCSRNAKKKSNGDLSDEDYSSGYEFYSSDEEKCLGKKNCPPSVAVLIGPCGSGKTSSVYAIAQEMGYKVLEINASSKRSGKDVLNAVKEATCSHQMASPSCGRSSIGTFFQKSPMNNTSSCKKSKKKRDSGPNKILDSMSSKISLIFVEDVDLVFENKDEGFIGALTSLTMNSKRPFILEVHTSKPVKMGTTYDSELLKEELAKSCPHLANLLAKQSAPPLLLTFERSQRNLNAEALLRIACLSEGIWVGKQWSKNILKYTEGDFRQALQQAQFWAGSIGRANILLANKARYPKEAFDENNLDVEDTVDHLGSERKDFPLACGCANIINCSYPYWWMQKNYIRHIWLNLDQIVKYGSQLIQNLDKKLATPKKSPPSSPYNNKAEMKVLINRLSTTPSLGVAKNYSLSPKWNFEKISPRIIRSAFQQRNMKRYKRNTISHNSSLNERLASNPHDDEHRPRSCPPHLKSEESQRKNNTHFLRNSIKRKLILSENCSNTAEQDEDKVKESSPMKSESKLQILRNNPCVNEQSKSSIKFCSEVLDLISASDIMMNAFEKVKNRELGKEMVFEIGALSNLVEYSMQEGPSEACCEMEAMMAKAASTISQHQMILPILEPHWILNKKSLNLDLVPHVRETCRIQEMLVRNGKSRTRQSSRHPTLIKFGQTLKEAMGNTLWDIELQNATHSAEYDALFGDSS